METSLSEATTASPAPGESANSRSFRCGEVIVIPLESSPPGKDAIGEKAYERIVILDSFVIAAALNGDAVFTSGQFVISENSGSGDTFAFTEQVDWTAKWHKKFTTRAAVGMYSFIDQKGVSSTQTSYINQNGTPLSGTYVNGNGLVYGAQNFNPVFVRGDATYSLESFPLYKGEFPITFR